MQPCEEKTDGVQRQRPKEVTGSWREGLWFAFVAMLYMIALGFAAR